MTPATAVAPSDARTPPQTARAFGTSFTLSNPKVPDAVRVGQMRKITRAHLRMWKVAEPQAGDIVLVVSELITNAVEHGADGRAIGLRVGYIGGQLRVEVTDENPSPAVLRCADDDEDSGRGVFLIAAFAEDWGVSEDGKTTWCEFTMPAGRP
ncbi:ATP-binding protein [Streptomyces sp. NPDC058657]|uniref:ATP-binding protein n=1 Tax=unclassified Streptomyces TaxID=2593676 RepID=UPI00364D59BE